MIRHFDKLLGGAARALLDIAGQRPDLAPQVGPIAELLSCVAADVDGHVARRLQDAEEMSTILRRARPLMPPSLRPELDLALSAELVRAADFTLDNIEAHTARLRWALIAVHTWLESPDGRSHPDLLDEIWAFVAADAEHAGRQARGPW